MKLASTLPLTLAFLASSPLGVSQEEEAEERGLRTREAGAFEGYTFFGPITSTKVYLVDMAGEVAHTWETGVPPGEGHYFLNDGTILRCAREDDNEVFHGGGIGGHVQKIDWDGKIVWQYSLANERQTQHHDVEPLPSGNVLVTTWEYRSAAEAAARGRDPEAIGDEGFWPDAILEIEPAGREGGKIVWEWHAWDHVIQDRDPRKPDYGSVPDHPELIDINGDHRDQPPLTLEEQQRQEELEQQMRELGYLGGKKSDDGDGRAKKRKKRPDWLHTNAVDYLPEFDLIALSTPHMSEIWVIDHSTSSKEAAGHRGGRFGRGGDLLYRWGNPRIWGAGEDSDRRLFYQHNPEWLEGARPGELRLMVFNNGSRRPDGNYSSVIELELPFDPERGFLREPGQPFGPSEPAWTYEDRETFHAAFISGAQRLPNGNTLICEGTKGRIFEVTRDGAIVWDYRMPFGGDVEDGGPAGDAPKHAVFRATRIAPDHPGLVGKGL